MSDYVEVAYKKDEKPFGSYPLELAQHLVERYSLQPGMKLLDNGCGRGEFMHAFTACGLDPLGTDLSDYCESASIVNLDRDKLPYENGYFDVVFSKSVLEHISNPEHYMGEMRRVLKQGGILILMVPDWKSQYKIFFDDPTHIRAYTEKSVSRLLEMSDYKNVHAERFRQIPLAWKHPLLCLASKAVQALGPVDKIYKNKFFRFSRELMVLASGEK